MVYLVGERCVVFDGVIGALRAGGINTDVLPSRVTSEPYAVVVGPNAADDVWTRRRLDISPSRTVVVASARSRAALRARARGVGGCIGPTATPAEAVAVVRFVLSGRPVGLPAGALLPPGARALTQRQAEVLALAAHGRSTPEIAADLCISARTVRNTLSALYRALGVRDRAEAVAWAWATGWIDDAGPPPVVPLGP